MKNAYIVGKVYDWIFFLGSPLLSLALGLGLYHVLMSSENLQFWIPLFFAIGMWSSHTHLTWVFYRSHNNQEIFKTHPYRFTIIPLVLIVLLFTTPSPVTYALAAVALLWDMYHSAMQVFGFGRLYDAKLGNDPQIGRKLDYYFNLLTYYLPLMLGITSVENLKQILAVSNYLELEPYLTKLPEIVKIINLMKPYLWVGLLVLVGAYIYQYYKYSQRGYMVSRQKIWLLFSTLFIRLILWQWSFIATSICIGVFHAIQYGALVWHVEQKRIKHLFGTNNSGLALVFMIGLSAALGFYILYAESLTGIRIYVFCMLIHFWYDGFIWSINKKQI